MSVLGIDPGISGALAIYDPLKSVNGGLRWIIEDVRAIDSSIVGQHALFEWLQRYSPERAFIERARAMPSIRGRRTMGATGAFNYGAVYGSLRTVVVCAGIPLHTVEPSAWKKHFGLKGSDKEKSRKLALELFPEQAETLKLKKHQNRAESMLIAAYGYDRINQR